MLIRHFAIPKQNCLQPLRQPTEHPQLEESRQYPNYLNRTLNPELPIEDVLVSHSPSKNVKNEQLSPLLQSPHKQTFLVKQYPQILEDFTNAQFQSPQQTQKQQKSRKRQVPRQPKYQIREKYSFLSPMLNNQAYISARNRNFSSLQVATNEPYLTNHQSSNEHLFIAKDAEDQDEERLINLHARSNCKNGELYRTVEKFRSHRMPPDDSTSCLQKKKYSLSLPKSQPPADSKKDKINQQEQVRACRQPENIIAIQSENSDRPLDLKRTQPFNMSHMKVQSRSVASCFNREQRRKILPADDEIDSCKNDRFQRKFKSRSCRKTSEEESIVIGKPEHSYPLIKSRKPIQIQQRFENQTQKAAPEKIEITYRVSLSQLKSICALPNLQESQLVMKIPEIFAVPLFSGNQAQNELFNKAAELIKHLQIKAKADISIKKYTNCLLILAGNIAVVWHYNGKVYFGGWKHEVLDEGCKQGLGLEWMPQKFVYYGEFANNKREGVGIMKNSNNQVLAGVWRENKFVRTLSMKVELQARGELN